MAKIKVKFYLNNITDNDVIKQEYIGLFNNNKIIFYENNKCVTIYNSDNKIVMNRISDDFKINMIFENKLDTLGTYYLNEYNSYFNIYIKTKKLEILDNKIIINYESRLEGDEQKNYQFELEYEVI